jgi:hypothetical protein
VQELQNGFTNMVVDSVPDPELSKPPAMRTKIYVKLFREGKANLEASLAYLRGELQEPECIHCSKKNSGPFRRCIVVKGLVGGSCTNCRYNEEQTRCSLRGLYYPIEKAVMLRLC